MPSVRLNCENPALCLADYMATPLGGIGARFGQLDGIDEMALIEAANICDETVTLAGGGAEPRLCLQRCHYASEVPKNH